MVPSKKTTNASNFHNEIDPGNYLVIASPSYSPFMPNTNEDFDVTTISNNTADNWLLEELDVLTGTVLDTLCNPDRK